MNKTIIPPRNVNNKMYDSQNLSIIVPVIILINKVWIIMVIIMDIGWFIFIKLMFIKFDDLIIIIFIISRVSLWKILILGINDGN